MTHEQKQLLDLLATLVRLHEQMIATLDRQLAAARAADSETMHRCQEQTEELVRQIARTEAQRRTLSREMAVAAGIAGADQGRGVTASRLAAALPEPVRTRLTEQASLLRERIQEVDRLNKVLAEVSRSILVHLRSACDAVARMAGTTGVYAANGKLREAQRSTVLEVMG